MKKFIFFVLFIGYASFVNTQFSQSIGLKFSYFGHNTFVPYYSPEFGATYDFFLNENHGIINELNVNLFSNRVIFSDPSGDPVFTQKVQVCHISYGLNYIFKRNEWFVKSGFNIRFADAVSYLFIDDELLEKSFFNSGDIKIFPEYHLGVGRDLDLGKINIRVSAFIDKALNDHYIEYGGTLGVIYEFNKE